MTIAQRADVSVVVPVANAGTTLRDCLAGLAAQDLPNARVEWIFVDNGSSDDSVEILRADGRVRLLSEARRGAYAARNTGARAATGELLAFLDPDCVPCRSWLESVVVSLRRPGVMLALGVRRPAPDRGLNRLLGDYDTTRDEWALTSGERQKYFGYTNNMGITRAAWDLYGPFEQRDRGADTIFVRRVVDGSGCDAVAFVPAMMVSHLEMDGVATYYRKVFTYGKSLQSYRRAIPVRPLTVRDRIAVFRRTCRCKGYPPAEWALLGALLALGLVAWAMGRGTGFLSTPRRQP